MGEKDQTQWQQNTLPFDYAANSSGSAHLVTTSFGRAGVGGIHEVDKASGGSVTRTVTYYRVQEQCASATSCITFSKII